MEEKDFATPVTGGDGATPRQGRRLASNDKGGKGKWALAIVGAVVAALLIGWVILCVVAGQTAKQGKIFPGVTVGGVDVSGMTTQAQVDAAVGDLVARASQGLEFPIRVNGQTVTVRGADAGLQVSRETYALANSVGAAGNFFSRGYRYLAGLLGKKTEVEHEFSIANQGYVDDLVRQAETLVSGGVVESTWQLEENEETAALILEKGTTGQTLAEDALVAQITAQLESGVSAPIEATVITTAPQTPDFDRVAEELRREPMDAALDVETDEITPHRLGLTLDAAKAKMVYDRLAEGETGKVELEVIQPEVTTLDLRATLFRDILGEASSYITGNADRVNNVRLAAAACDGTILLPGQQMSYNQTTGERTTAKGYREAIGYTSKGQEMMVGGGVCQPSSTLYHASLLADLEIVHRKNHRYTVSYGVDGLDATVSWPNLDYVFANNTKYPIKVSMTIENKTLTVRIYGTKTDDKYVEMETVRLSTTPAGTSYQADPNVPQGSTRVLQSAHTGKKVEVYKKTYDGDGTLLSRDWISTDTYLACDKIIAYNPLDGVPGVIDPVPPEGETTDPSQPPAEPTTPPESTTPEPSPDPTQPVAPPPTVPEPTPDPTPEVPAPTPEVPVVDTPPSQQTPEGIPFD